MLFLGAIEALALRTTINVRINYAPAQIGTRTLLHGSRTRYGVTRADLYGDDEGLTTATCKYMIMR